MTIPYTSETWSAEVITDAKLNNIEQGVVDAHLQPAAHVYHNATQSLTDTVEASLAFNNERYDQVGGVASNQHDNSSSNSRLTCRYAGIYVITANVEFASVAAAQLRLRLRLNGSTVIAPGDVANINSTTYACAMSTTTQYALAVNDYVEVRATQNTGGPLNVSANPEFCWVRVG